jgi:CubicO group peptidase (beta-lactamase class C family)
MKPFFISRLLCSTVCMMLCAYASFSQAFATHHGMTSAEYQSKFDSYKSQGYRLVQVDGYAIGSTANYAAIWEKSSGPALATHHAMTAADYQSKFNTYKSQGYLLVQVDGYSIGNTAYYAAIWEKKSGDIGAHHGMTGAEYQKKYDEYKKQGYQPVWVSGYGIGNTAYYAAIWEKTSASIPTHHGMSSADYQDKFNEYMNDGYRLKMVSGYNVGNTDYYAAIWEKRRGPGWSARHRMTHMGYQNEFDNHIYSGYKPAHISGYVIGGKARYASIWESTGAWSSEDLDHIDKTVLAFMKKHSVPGTSIALVKDGKLVFSKGYGVMDKSTGEAPGPNTMFRVASVSKPITSIAVMKMIQDKKFKIDDKVFGSGALLGTTFGTKEYGAWEKAVNVQHLLEHTAGGDQWNNKSDGGAGDPMFQQLTYNHKDLIGWVLDERNPGKKPGDESDYSNFGYCVLGRIIEKESGQTYENYVKNSVLKQCGINNMHIAADSKEGRRYNETVYYDDNDPYSMKVKRMDAHGGWIASSVDLMRLLVKADGFSTKPDILNSTSFTTMTTPCAVDKGYAKGWSVNGKNYFHNGSFPGGGAIIVRTGGGLSWAFVMNTRWQGEADGMMWDIVNGIKKWPTHDWF